jgi:hypothetical protein
MKRFLVVAVCAVGALYGELPAIAQDAPAQSTVSAGTQQTGVVLVKLSPPVYPPLARQARIMGDVEIQLSIRKDGASNRRRCSVDTPCSHREHWQALNNRNSNARIAQMRSTPTR